MNGSERNAECSAEMAVVVSVARDATAYWRAEAEAYRHQLREQSARSAAVLSMLDEHGCECANGAQCLACRVAAALTT